MSDRSLWTDVISESDHLLESVSASAGHLFATYLRNACHAVIQFDVNGAHSLEIELPSKVGSVGGFGGKMNADEVFYAFTSFTHPTSIYRLDIESGTNTEYSSPKVRFKPEGYETKQVWYASKDGTQIPMFIVHRRGLLLNGQNPTLLYAYGGLTSVSPQVSVRQTSFS